MGTKGADIVVVMVAAANQEEAGKIADHVVRARLAACASVIASTQSTYWWDGKVVNDQESLVLIKTQAEKYTSLQEAIQQMHSYKVPEIIALPVAYGFPPYLEWVWQETS